MRGAAEVRALLRELARVAPDTKMPVHAWALTMLCVGWPAKVRTPLRPPRWQGVPPVLLINSRHDPATPYKSARNVARQTGATLLTHDGTGHAMHMVGSECVDKATERYLITLRTPARGARCPAIEPRH